MDEIFEKTLLYDFYGELLTDNQKKIYELYHLDDLSLGEISQQMNISRQGVHDALKRCDISLKNFEEKLGLVDKFIKNKNAMNEIHQITTNVLKDYQQDDLLKDSLNTIDMIACRILEEL